MLFLWHCPARSLTVPPVTLLIVSGPRSCKAAQSQLLSQPAVGYALPAPGWGKSACALQQTRVLYSAAVLLGTAGSPGAHSLAFGRARNWASGVFVE